MTKDFNQESAESESLTSANSTATNKTPLTNGLNGQKAISRDSKSQFLPGSGPDLRGGPKRSVNPATGLTISRHPNTQQRPGNFHFSWLSGAKQTKHGTTARCETDQEQTGNRQRTGATTGTRTGAQQRGDSICLRAAGSQLQTSDRRLEAKAQAGPGAARCARSEEGCLTNREGAVDGG
jgi:hypothetical protein